jgi:xanthine dehydrogenase accessory factor
LVVARPECTNPNCAANWREVPLDEVRIERSQFGGSTHAIGMAAAVKRCGIVLGCDELGSAIAHALHCLGFAVVLIDAADPAYPRRGMAFTDAWYLGNAELEGATACFCASLRSIPAVLGTNMIAATTWSWPSVAAAMIAELIVDARSEKPATRASLRGHTNCAIGVGSGFRAGDDVDAVIAPDDREAAGAESSTVGYSIRAERIGRLMTTRHIGDIACRGDILAHVGAQPIPAPVDGVLRGLSARGARIRCGQEILNVDPRGDRASCFGVDAGSRRIASAVIALHGRFDQRLSEMSYAVEAPKRS